MMRNKKVWFSVGPLALIHILVLGAAFFAPYDPAEQHRDYPFAPPMRIHFVDSGGKFHLRPYVCPWVNQAGSIGSPHYVEDCSRISRLRFLVREGPNGSRAIPGTWHLFGVGSPLEIDPRRHSKRKTARFRSCRARIRRFKRLHSPAPSLAGDVGCCTHAGGALDTAMHPCRSHSLVPRAGRGRASVKLGKYACQPSEVLRSRELLVDVRFRHCFGSHISALLLARRRPSGAL